MLALTLVVGIVAVLGLFIWNATRPRSDAEKQWWTLPGPTIFPLIGNMPGIIYNSLFGNLLLQNLYHHQQSGKVIKWYFPGYPQAISVTDPVDVQYILKDNFSNYIKGEITRKMLEPFLGRGIFTSDGEEWYYQRTTARPLFATKNREAMIETFQRNAGRLIAVLERAAASGTIVDMQDLFMRFTLDSFAEIGFGVQIGSLEAPPDKPVPFAAAFDYVQKEIEMRSNMPGRRFFTEKRFQKEMRILDDVIYEIIRLRRSEPPEVVAARTDLLSRFMTVERTNRKQSGDHADNVDELFLRDMLMNFFIAGRDTTALLLTWTLHLLSSNREAERNVVSEVCNLVKTSQSQAVTFSDLKTLKYMQACFDETLRLYPPVPFNMKVAVKDDVLPGCGATVRAGMIVSYNPFTIHRLKEYWGEDAEIYRPERWLVGRDGQTDDGEETAMAAAEGDEARKGPLKHPYQFVPFQRGPRICLGMDMAYEEAKLLLSYILPKFTFEHDPHSTVEMKKSITLPMKNGLRMRVARRAET